eukprot:tig00000405_g478.t1
MQSLKGLAESIAERAVETQLSEEQRASGMSGATMFDALKILPKFVLMTGPLFDITDYVMHILSWRDKPTSILAYVCFYPVVLAFVPTLCIVAYLFRRYYKRTRARLGGIQGILQENDISMERTKRNLARIQGGMAAYCSFAAVVNEFRKRLTFKDAAVTWATAKVSIALSLALAALAILLPARLQVLCAGTGVFLCRTAHARALFSVLSQHRLVRAIVSMADGAPAPETPTTRLGALAAAGGANGAAAAAAGGSGAGVGAEPLADRITVETYEHQRWWVGLSWCDKLLPADPPVWSLPDGTEPRPKSSFVIPPGYKWAGEWAVATQPGGDEDGWEYADNHWNGFSLKRSPLEHFTRRRKWTRVMARA